ncbi:DUF4428 domain-containing protein [Clostridium perfringens]|nr:DUF4428 domain-containing protein [Clostridium perfringens]
MGLFSKKEICSICKENETKTKLSDGYICSNCLKNVGMFQVTKPLKTYQIKDIEKLIVLNYENKVNVDNFNATKKIEKYIEFDDTNRKWLIPNLIYGKYSTKVYDYKDILEFELLEDGEVITKGGLGRAVAGGILFGGVGAIVGGITGNKKTKSVVNSLKIKITLNDMNNPTIYIPLIKSKTKTNSVSYRGAYGLCQEILSTLDIITKSNKEINTNANKINYSEADEIEKFKHLLDAGIITEEEFEKKKKIILGI